MHLDPTPPLGEAEGLWRYRSWLGTAAPLSLGEPRTPLTTLDVAGRHVWAKLEGALPTGSFKDRGAAVLVSELARTGIEQVVEDSSGNAGAALAAYAARAQIRCELFVPESASSGKVAQAEAYGATVVRVPGERAASSEAAIRAAANGAVYASHAWNPLYQIGTATFAFELWEQFDRQAPDVVVFPLGGGALLLGAHLGFSALQDAGLIEAMPALVGVQAAACAPIAAAWDGDLSAGRPRAARQSVAEGILISHPIRHRAILDAVRASGGTVVAVSESEILAAYRDLARQGVYAEPTAAVSVAGLAPLIRESRLAHAARIVVAITSTGLKSPRTPPVLQPARTAEA